MFFGRKQEITEYLGILDTLRGPDRSQVLVISGASGSGKSSLLRAGLIPRLRRKPEWVVISPFEVARDPVRNLLDRLGEALAGLGIPTDGLDLTKPPDDPRALAQTLDETLRRLEQAPARGCSCLWIRRKLWSQVPGQRATRPGCCSMHWPGSRPANAACRRCRHDPHRVRATPGGVLLDPRCDCGKHP